MEKEVVAAPINPNIFALENKPTARLGHQLGEGSRKICKNCSHKMDDHDVVLPSEDHGKLIIGRLFDHIPSYEARKKVSELGANSEDVAGTVGGVEALRRRKKKGKKLPGEEGAEGVKAVGEAGKADEADEMFLEAEGESVETEAESELEELVPVQASKKAFQFAQYNVTIENAAEENVVVEYTWVPTNDTILIEKYFAALPEEERPISGTAGALDRRQKLQYQLPYHDSNPDASRSIKTDEDRELHTKFVTTIKEKVVGVGQLIEWTETVRKLHSDEDAAYGKCRTCGQPMNPGDVAIVTDHGEATEIWHPNCFRCITCQQRLVDMLYFYKDGQYYCGRHFGDTMYPRCAGCDELIFSKEYTFAESKNWHFDHFCCFGCDRELGGHRYMVRDDQPFCFDCYMRKFAKNCQACRGKIAPDQQRISYRHLHWHADGRCFQCKRCHKVLLNQKFIIKNEEVFCSADCKNKYFPRVIAANLPCVAMSVRHA